VITWALAMVATLALWQRWAPSPRAHTARTAHPTTPRPAPTDWADVADAIAQNVRAGDSLRTALDRVLADRELDGTAIHRGARLDDVLEARRAGLDEVVVLRALQTAWSVGGSAAQGLHGAAALLRERHALRAEAAAHSAQARASARVLTLVPAVFAVFGVVTSASFRAVVVTPAGATAVAMGALLNLTGWTWMRHTIRRATT
jgi:Flp pilus assembly protein TadB